MSWQPQRKHTSKSRKPEENMKYQTQLNDAAEQRKMLNVARMMYDGREREQLDDAAEQRKKRT